MIKSNYNTDSIELLPRLTIQIQSGYLLVAFEWLMWSVYFIKDVPPNENPFYYNCVLLGNALNPRYEEQSNDRAFEHFCELFDHHFGEVRVENHLISIHTGGYSENEVVVRHFTKTLWWRSHLVHESRGGHYYFDLDFQKDPDWIISKSTLDVN